MKKQYTDKVVIFVLQNGLKSYMKNRFNIELFRCPDEAYIIEYNTGEKVVKILEKKEQRVEGSVETKFWSCPSLKEEYEIVLGQEFKVSYGLCVNNFLKKKFTSECRKWIILNMILKKHNIDVMFGNDSDYFNHLDRWLDIKVEPQVQLETEPQVQLETEPQVQLETELQVQVETEPQVQLETELQVQLETEPQVQVETEPQVQLEERKDICEEYVKSTGEKCTCKYKIIRGDGKKVCGRHKVR